MQQLKFLEKMLSYKVDPWVIDQNGDWPLSQALMVPCSKLGRNYPVIETLINCMTATLADQTTPPKREDKTNKILLRFATLFSLVYVQKEKALFQKIVTILKSYQETHFIEIKEEDSGLTPFTKFCWVYSRFPSLTSANFNETKMFDFLPPISNVSFDEHDCWSKARDIMEIFIKEFDPELNYKVSHKSNEKLSSLRTISTSLIALGEENSNEPMLKNSNLRPGFELVLSHSKDKKGNCSI